ncbi:MAG: NrsF family protein [Vicinamibacterales bacterium]
MKTDDLIDLLSRNATAVAPLRPPAVRMAWWVAAALTYALAMAIAVLAAMGGALPAVSLLFLVQQAAALATAASAAYGAFASVVPGANVRWRPLLAASATLWVGALLAGMAFDIRRVGSLGVGVETDWPCVLSMTIGGVVLLVPILHMVRRGAAFQPRLTAFLGGLAALSVASIEACITRPHAFTSTMLLWHGVTLAALVLLTMLMGRRLIRWPAPRLAAA